MIEPQQGMKVDDVIEWAEYAEKSGYGYIFRSDHLLPIGTQKRGTPSPECWVSLGALAARTKKIKFGPMVSPVGFRNPAMLGRMACTIHSFSKGRLLLGLGSGWYKDEYLAHGFPFPEFKVRRKELIEAFEVIRPMTEGRRVDFEGAHYSAHVDCFPRPYGKRVHLIGGGRNPRIVRALAKYVDEWNIFNSSLEVYSQLKAELEKSRGDGNVEVSQMGAFIIADSKRDVSSRTKSYMRAMGLSGDPDSTAERLASKGILCGTVVEFVEQVNRRRSAGIEKFYFQVIDTKDKEMVRLLTQTLKEEF